MNFLSDFGVQPILLAAQVVNFFILLFLLKRFLYKPLLKVLEERKQKITESLKNAEEIERKLSETEIQTEKILAGALAEGQKILDQTNETVAQIMEKANKTAEQILLKAADDAKKTVALEREILMSQSRIQMGSLVALAIKQVTGKLLTEKDKKEIIEREIKNIS